MLMNLGQFIHQLIVGISLALGRFGLSVGLGRGFQDKYPGTQGLGRVDQLPRYRFTTRYPTVNNRMQT